MIVAVIVVEAIVIVVVLLLLFWCCNKKRRLASELAAQREAAAKHVHVEPISEPLKETALKESLKEPTKLRKKVRKTKAKKAKKSKKSEPIKVVARRRRRKSSDNASSPLPVHNAQHEPQVMFTQEAMVEYAQRAAFVHEESLKVLLERRADDASFKSWDGGTWESIGTGIPESIVCAMGADERMELRREWLELGNEVGRGAFAVVYMGQLTYDTFEQVVAVKEMLQLDDAESEQQAGESSERLRRGERLFAHEMKLMKSMLPHDNVVRLIGVCHDNVGPPWIVTEFCAGGSLLGYLRAMRRDAVLLEPAHAIDIMLQAARGVLHLHSQKILHRDIAARNMLLTHEGCLKVADFGLSRAAEHNYRTRSKTGPLRWLAVECLVDRLYSAQSDVWAFGVLMWEVLTRGLTPYFDQSNQMKLVVRIVRHNLRLPMPAGCAGVVGQMLQRCWRADPNERPDMLSLVAFLEQLRDDEETASRLGAPAFSTISSYGSFFMHGAHAAVANAGYDEIVNDDNYIDI